MCVCLYIHIYIYIILREPNIQETEQLYSSKNLCEVFSNTFEFSAFCLRQITDYCLIDTRDSWNVPTRVEGLNQVKVRAAFASGVISTAIGDDGSLWVWGKSKHGQLGLGKGISETVVPSRVEALAGEKIVKVVSSL